MYLLWESLNGHLFSKVYQLQPHNPLLKLQTYAYCQHVGHEFKNCPFVDDKLKRLSKEEFITSLPPITMNTLAI
jgi:hypothetical protein